MAVVVNNFQPTAIIQTPANVYVGLANPTSAIPPVYGLNTWGLGASGNTYYIDSNGQPFDTSTTGGIATVAVGSTPGSGYSVGDVLQITQTGASGGTVVVATLSGSGVATVNVVSPGYGYSAASNLATTHLTGSGNDAATITISTLFAGFHIGLSDGPVTTNFAPKFHEIRADQHAAPVDAAFVTLETEIDFVVKEALLKNLSRFFSSVTGTYNKVYSPNADVIQIGSIQTDASLFNSLLLVAADRSFIGHFYIVNAYRTFLKSAIQTTFKRDTETLWKLKFACIADVTRVYGDMVLQLVRV